MQSESGLADETSMAKITHNDLRRQVVFALRASIMSGELDSDTVYSAATISGKLGVSVTPVREAILDLANAGLVEVVRNRGFRILGVGDGALDEIVQVRQMLEGPAMHILTERASDNDLKDLASSVEEMKQLSPVQVLQFLHRDHEFHLRLMELTQNSRLVKVTSMLQDQMRLYAIGSKLTQRSIVGAATEHEMILEALIERNAIKAETLMRDHISRVRNPGL